MTRATGAALAVCCEIRRAGCTCSAAAAAWLAMLAFTSPSPPTCRARCRRVARNDFLTSTAPGSRLHTAAAQLDDAGMRKLLCAKHPVPLSEALPVLRGALRALAGLEVQVGIGVDPTTANFPWAVLRCAGVEAGSCGGASLPLLLGERHCCGHRLAAVSEASALHGEHACGLREFQGFVCTAL